MSRFQYLSNAVMWAAAIIASALVGASPFFTTVLLPTMAATALILTWPKSRAAEYRA